VLSLFLVFPGRVTLLALFASCCHFSECALVILESEVYGRSWWKQKDSEVDFSKYLPYSGFCSSPGVTGSAMTWRFRGASQFMLAPEQERQPQTTASFMADIELIVSLQTPPTAFDATC
jgi:hypothetical protein